MNTRTKRKIKNIVCIALAALLLCGAVGACIAIFGNEKRDIPVTAFHIGGIDAEGNYEERNDTLYTKDLIECQGLEIEPVYDSEATYKIFFYDYHKRFFESTDVLDGVYSDAPETARYCRILLMPDPADGVSSEEFEIGVLEVWGYADDLKIKVNKKQNFELTDIFAVCMAGEESYRKGFIATSTKDDFVEDADYSVIGPIDCSKVAKYIFIFDEIAEYSQQIYFFNDQGGALDPVTYTAKSGVDVKIEVPEGAKYMYVNFLEGEEFIINEYLVR